MNHGQICFTKLTMQPPPSDRLHQLFGDQPVLADGAMGTILYDRGVFINRCYDELNLSDPDLIRAVHEEYLLAGAQLIETNTFGANSFRLQRFGLQAKVHAINQAGVRLAREAASHLLDKQAIHAWVAGSLGPLGIQMEPLGKTSREEARAAYAEQIRALAGMPATENAKPAASEAAPTSASASAPTSAPAALKSDLPSVDLLIFETIMSLAEAEQALIAARETAPHLPIVALVTVDEESLCLDGTHPELAAARLTAWGADGVGVNCSTGPAAVLSAIEHMAAGTSLPLFAMPNAGMPRAIDGRNIYLSSPEYMASFARKFLKAGVQCIGGCCGTTPAHIRVMRSFLRAEAAQLTAQQPASQQAKQQPGQQSGQQSGSPQISFPGSPTQDTTGRPLIQPAALAARSTIGRLLAERAFITLVEIVPPRGIDTHKELAGALLLAEHGIDAINVPDSPRASARMSAQSLCIQIQQATARAGRPIDTVLHYTCRDRNILSIQSDLLGASSIGLKNILCLTGDPPKLGNYPDATAVFDVDAIGLVNIVRNLNHALDIGNNSIGTSTGFTVAVAANPGVPDIENELRRFAYKVEAGAEYAITQPVFDLRLLETFLRRIEQFHIPVIAGIWPLTSLRNAEFMKNDLRVAVPDTIMARMANPAAHSGLNPQEASRAEGIRIAQEMLATARPMVQGVAASAPFGRYETAIECLQSVLQQRAAQPAPA
jgi:methionine synthase I (cobalamin-dependent)/5,10-methylenetetrahydrofolate reductase